MKTVRRNFVTPLYFLCFLLKLTEAYGGISTFITYGKVAEPHSAPFLAFLNKTSDINSNAACGGALISHNYVLTAGHCLRRAASIDVYLGAHDLTAPSEYQIIVPAEKWIAYSNQTSQDDIALIKLKESVNYTKGVQPAILPSRSDLNKSYVGDVARIFGWGLTEKSIMSQVLLYADMPILDIKSCNKPVTFICAEKIKLSGTCKGDSGGPLVLGGVSVGLVHGSRCALGDLTSPSIFTKINLYLDWIEQNSDVLNN